MNTQSEIISVTNPVSQAFERVKDVLFRPFDLRKWFVIGFCAWLAYLGQGGGGGNGVQGGPPKGGNFRQSMNEAWGYVMNNLSWILPLVIGGLVLGLVLWVLFTWLSSRGQFMFLHCVALNRAEVRRPWHEFVRQGNSLTLFRLVLDLFGMVTILPLLAVAIFLIVRMVDRDSANVPGVLMVIAAILLIIALGIVLGLIGKFTRDFVVPIMFLRRNACLDGWRELRGLMSAHVGSILLYLLFQIVLHVAIGIIVMLIVFGTCCVAGCLLALPYLGTVLMLPVLVFVRSYSLYYLAQYGPQYDVFPAPTSGPGAS